jgi:hypothetical protein
MVLMSPQQWLAQWKYRLLRFLRIGHLLDSSWGHSSGREGRSSGRVGRSSGRKVVAAWRVRGRSSVVVWRGQGRSSGRVGRSSGREVVAHEEVDRSSGRVDRSSGRVGHSSDEVGQR